MDLRVLITRKDGKQLASVALREADAHEVTWAASPGVREDFERWLRDGFTGFVGEGEQRSLAFTAPADPSFPHHFVERVRRYGFNAMVAKARSAAAQVKAPPLGLGAIPPLRVSVAAAAAILALATADAPNITVASARAAFDSAPPSRPGG